MKTNNEEEQSIVDRIFLYRTDTEHTNNTEVLELLYDISAYLWEFIYLSVEDSNKADELIETITDIIDNIEMIETKEISKVLKNTYKFMETIVW